MPRPTKKRRRELACGKDTEERTECTFDSLDIQRKRIVGILEQDSTGRADFANKLEVIRLDTIEQNSDEIKEIRSICT